MQKYLSVILLLSVLSCTPGARKNSAADGKRVLTVTIEPQRYFLDRIVGDTYAINTLVPPGTSPETYEPAPSVMVDMSKSELYFMVGDLGFEKAWSERLAENNPGLTIVNCSEGIELMEGHAHHHDDDPGHVHHGHGHGHGHEGMDPHVWSSPRAVKVFTRNMVEALADADPDNADAYRANFVELTRIIERTDEHIRSLLENTPRRSFIIYHPALGCFARDYGLRQFSIEFEGKAPSPSQIKTLVDLAREEGINTVFIERGFDKKNAEVIAAEIGAELFVIDPLAYEWDQELIRLASILARDTDEYLR